MSYKIDVSAIVKDHIKTLINAKTGKPDFRDYFFFLIIPLGLSVFLVYEKIFLKGDFVNSIIGGLSIYVGLSLNFIVLLFDLSAKEIFKEQDKRDIIKESVANISVSIFYSILIILFSLLADIKALEKISNAVCYFLIVEFIMTLLMILKRVYILLSEQLDSTRD
ncbi:hypothetical protein M1D52_07355 [Olivibacter sp. SA151]|uniref:hypothetical protein n=1 Tax=Olivibacter jilunii TaxID=985016 RepID=UPI003F16B5A2